MSAIQLNHSDFQGTGWVNSVLKKLDLKSLIITKAYRIPAHIVERVKREAEAKKKQSDSSSA